MIKNLSQKYIEEIVNLHKDSIFKIWDNLGREYSIKGVKNFIIKVFQNGDVYGYFNNKDLVGAIGIELRNNKAEISFLLVDPKFQRKGIGRKLMIFIEKNLQGVNKIYLDVLTKNKAVDFYKKMGYKTIRERKDKYIMEKKLK